MTCGLRWLCLLTATLLGAALGTEVLIEDAPPASQEAGDPYAVSQMLREFEQLHAAGLLPIELSDAPVNPGVKFGTTEVAGTEVPVYLLAKIGLGVLKAAKIVGKGALVASQVAGAVQGELSDGGAGGDNIEVTRNSNLVQQDTSEILAETAGTATAFFRGPTVGELFFAQAFLPDGALSNTVVTGTFAELPRRATFRLELRDVDTCAPVPGSEDTTTTLLSMIHPDVTGRAALLLSKAGMRVLGPDGIVGQTAVIVPNTGDASGSAEPVACAVIGQQKHTSKNRPISNNETDSSIDS